MQSNTVHILLVAEMLGYGGMSTYVEEFGKMLHSQGYDLSLLSVTTHKNSKEYKTRFSSFSHIYHHFIPSYHGMMNKISICVYSFFHTLHIIKNHHIDLLWCVGPLATFGLVPLLWLFKKPKVYFFLSPLDLELTANYGGKNSAFTSLKSNIYKKLIKTNLSTFQIILTCSEYAKTLLISKYGVDPKKITVTPLFISDFTNNRIVDKPKISERFSLNCTKPIIFFPSRFEPWKNPEIILKAVASISRTDIQVVFSGIPNPDHLKKWSAWAVSHNLQGRIYFLPFQKKQDLYSLYQIADCVVFPSRNLEMFGYVALEGLGFGKPVIGSNEGAIPEMLNKADRRLVVRDNTPEAYAEKILWVLGLSKKHKSELSLACRKAAQIYLQKKNITFFTNVVKKISAV
jgi:glycosyltransferase involved in cell wall biosynthesis